MWWEQRAIQERCSGIWFQNDALRAECEVRQSQTVQMFEGSGDSEQNPDRVTGGRASTLQLLVQGNTPTHGGDQLQRAVGQPAAVRNRDDAAVGMSLKCGVFLQQLSGI